MFTDAFADETNFRVVFYGPAYVGKTATLRYIHQHAPPDRKSKLSTVTINIDDPSHPGETETTVWFDMSLPEYGESNARKIRINLYALHGPVNYESSSRLLLKGVDAVVFLADAQRARQDANRWWAMTLREHLAELGRELAGLPLCVGVTKTSFEGSDPALRVGNALGLPASPIFDIDPTTGRGIPEMLAAVVTALKDGVAEGGVAEI